MKKQCLHQMIAFVQLKFKRLLQTGFFYIFGSSVANKIIAFLSSIVLIRLLTKSEYGVFTYAWNIYNIAIVFSGLGLTFGILQICSERSEDKPFCNEVCGYGIKIGTLINCGLSCIILLIAFCAPLKIGGSDSLLVLLCALPIFYFWFELHNSYLRAQKRNMEYARTTTLNTIFVFGGSVLGALLFREKGLVIGYYFAYIVSLIFLRILSGVSFRGVKGGPAKEVKGALLKISVISMCNNGLSQILYLADVFVIGIVISQEAIVASYKVATMIPMALTFIPQALVLYLYPYFAERRGDRAWCLKNFKSILLWIGLLNLCISGMLSVFAPWIIRITFGGQYLDAVLPFRILAASYFFSGTFRVLAGNLLVTQRKLAFNFLVSIVCGTVNVIADFLLINWWGMTGAAVATLLVVLISGALNTLYFLYILKKKV